MKEILKLKGNEFLFEYYPDDDRPSIQSCDGDELKLRIGVLQLSETVKNLTEDCGIQNTIPLPNIDGKLMRMIFGYCEFIFNDAKYRKLDEILKYNTNFFLEMEDITLKNLIFGTNYLDIQFLLELCCEEVSKRLKNKTQTERIQFMNFQYLNITKSFPKYLKEFVFSLIEWKPELHFKFPVFFKDKVFQFLLSLKTIKHTKIPRFVIYEIIKNISFL